MTRKETALEALNKKIPKLEEKIDQDKKLLEELKTKREVLEVEALRKFLHDWTIVNKVDRRREKNQKSSSN